jgi:hypothetical protein
MSQLVYLVIESSDVGEAVLGVFSTLEKARQILPPMSSGRLDRYRVEYRLFDEPPEPRTPWQVVLDRGGALITAELVVRCNCEDDEGRFVRGSFIDHGGNRLHLVVFARSPGEAVAAAQRYREQLLEHGVWGSEARQLAPIEADPSPPARIA